MKRILFAAAAFVSVFFVGVFAQKVQEVSVSPKWTRLSPIFPHQGTDIGPFPSDITGVDTSRILISYLGARGPTGIIAYRKDDAERWIQDHVVYRADNEYTNVEDVEIGRDGKIFFVNYLGGSTRELRYVLPSGSLSTEVLIESNSLEGMRLIKDGFGEVWVAEGFQTECLTDSLQPLPFKATGVYRDSSSELFTSNFSVELKTDTVLRFNQTNFGGDGEFCAPARLQRTFVLQAGGHIYGYANNCWGLVLRSPGAAQTSIFGTEYYMAEQISIATARQGTMLLERDGEFIVSKYPSITRANIAGRFAIKALTADSIWLVQYGPPKIDSTTAVSSRDINAPSGFLLEQNYPNPFNPSTTISFALPKAGEVNLSIFNANGQLVRIVAAGKFNAGSHSFTWDTTNERGGNVSGGIYFARLIFGQEVRTRKLIYLR